MMESMINRAARLAACMVFGCLSATVFAAGSSITNGKGAFNKSEAKLTAKQKAAISILQSCKMDSAPEKLYMSFNQFCRAFFGAEKEPLVYAKYGNKLVFEPEGKWFHSSANSAAIASETNLPATSYIEYGKVADGFNKETEKTERPFYLHLHYLKGLTEGQTYIFRVVAVDERGNKIVSKTGKFTAKMPAGAVAVAPTSGTIKLSKPDTTYVLTGDHTTAEAGIVVNADNVTLDLNGYTVTFGKGATHKNRVHGISAIGSMKTKVRYQSTGFKLFNGTVVQGDSEILKTNDRAWNFIPVSIQGGDTEIAGISIAYHGPQIWGMSISHPRGRFEIHHNVIKDMGGMIKNRHGAGTRAMGFTKAKSEYQGNIHHNLVKRTRQNGLGGATKVQNNEIYVDSFSTNSFAVQPFSKPGKDAGDLTTNRVFGTGFNPYGIGWAHENMLVKDNLIHFQGIDVQKRWHERWGDINKLEGMRVTNYGKGGQVRNNLRYEGNVIVLKGGQGCELRGTGFFSDVSIEGLVFVDNVVKVIAQDTVTKQAGCIATHGHTGKPESKPVWYLNNTLISNVSLINFGDKYAKGHNHYFKDNKLIRVGQNPNFHSFTWGGAYWSYGHKLIDNEYVNMKTDDVFIYRTGGKSHFFVQWTLDLKAKARAEVVIRNLKGEVEFQGKIDENGRLQVPLTQCMVRPGERANTNSTNIMVDKLTPHTITVTMNGTPVTKKIEMLRKQRLEM